MRSKKYILAIAAVIVLSAVTAFNASSLSVSAESAILYEASTGEVLYEKNADQPMLIASITKIMTALVAIENADSRETVTITAESAGVEGSSMYLKPGEQLAMKTLLYGLMLESGNDAAVAIAVHVSGSVDKFAELMNKKAAELGCKNTHFVNPNGLDAEGHYSSARDVALIMAAALDNVAFRQIVSTKTITAEGRSFKNHNKLLWSYDGMVGGKTGYTKRAGRTLVTCAERDGMSLICVTLNDPDDWNDHIKLLDDAFSNYQVFHVCSEGQTMGSVPVISGMKSSVDVLAASAGDILVKKGGDVSVKLELPQFAYADVKAGDNAGRVYAEVDGVERYSAELVFSENIAEDRSERLSIFERFRHSLQNK